MVIREENKPIMEIISRDGRGITFLMKGISLTMGNALRRIMMSEIRIFSTDVVQFFRNDSLLDDEFVAHRLGMVVLDSSILNEIDNNVTEVVLSLNVVCTSNEPLDVTVDMIKTDNPSVKALYGDTIITRLFKGGGLSFSAIARVGRGIDHAKWNPVCGIGMEPVGKDVKISMETTGALDNKVIVEKALKILSDKLSKLQSAL